MKTVAGLFDTHHDAEQAVNALQNMGIKKEQISVLARETVLRERTTDPAAAATGALGGGTLGGLAGLLLGMTTTVIPGIGPVITAGTLATTLGTTGLGAVAGGILGAMTSAGIPDEYAHVYAESVRRGGIVLTIEVEDEQVSSALEALERANAVNIAARRDELRREGWEYFDETRSE
jgi:uncharacterized membrane protein